MFCTVTLESVTQIPHCSVDDEGGTKGLEMLQDCLWSLFDRCALEHILHALIADEGMVAVALHGDLEQLHRNQTLIRFANGSANVLVASDVAARGLDIEAVDVVFNYNLPAQPEVYTHRMAVPDAAAKRAAP